MGARSRTGAACAAPPSPRPVASRPRSAAAGMRPPSGAAFLIVSLLGCSANDSRPAADAVVRDSAGVAIVETRAPAWREPGEGWRVAPEPTLQIGMLEGEAPYLFDRIMGLVRFEDGVIAVGTMGAGSIRYFDANGRFLREAGRAGRGPGEFPQLMGMKRLPGDAILAEAGGGMEVRMNVYDKRGRFVRDFSARREVGPDGRWSPVGWFDDGTAVAATYPQRAPDGSTGVVVDSSTFTLFDGTAYGPPLLKLPAVMWSDGADPRRLRLEFGPALAVVVAGSRFYYSFAADPDVLVFRVETDVNTGQRGFALERVLRGAWQRTPVTEADIAAFKHAYTGGASGEDGQPASPQLIELRRSNLERMSFADHFPAHGRMMVDRTGAVWLERYTPSAPTGGWNATRDEPSVWEVYDADGVWLGPVELPGDFIAREVGADYVLGLWRDENDVEFVRLYELSRD